MKKISILTAIVFFTVSVAFGQDGDQKTEKKAHIDFKELVYDFGNIELGSDGTHIFEFKNSGKESLTIASVKTSCGCTTPTYSKEPIKKNGTGGITVKYDTRRPGPFTKTITVNSNADNTPVVLKIKGTVINKTENAG